MFHWFNISICGTHDMYGSRSNSSLAS
uniref:Uncharacterized protein n=1 Tax=Rhizophora mucronata TaxID=61149 RepID=A0A2P2IK62_RHIMU